MRQTKKNFLSSKHTHTCTRDHQVLQKLVFMVSSAQLLHVLHVHPMVELLRESVRGPPESQQADERLCCTEAHTAVCDVWHRSQREGNNESESNGTPTTALRQMDGSKQLCTEINIAGCVVLTGRLSGRRVADCNRITGTLGKGEALSF